MPVSLDSTLSWKSATGDDEAMLESLQPNILKGHTREFLTLLFLKFQNAGDAASLLSELATDGIVPPLMKSAIRHLEEVAAFNSKGVKGTPYVGVGLTADGYRALGIPEHGWPSDPSVRRGMTNNETVATLGDPDVDGWEGHFLQKMDAVILVGDQLAETRDIAERRVRDMIASRPSIVILGEQTGNGLHNRNGDGIEHFGYVDGRSQPIFLDEDLVSEKLREDGTTNWDAGFGLGRVLVSDAAAPDPQTQFGSYFVFRKLEQDVRKFKTQEAAFATSLGLAGDTAERAGAMLVGRFEDGTPLTIQSADGAHSPVQNDFTYDSDPEGGKCPFFAHIRKMNPRGSGGFETVERERLHIMARRGQTYGVRTDDPNDGKLNNKPTHGVGLLFMAFNSSLVDQFEFVQKNWANNAGFPSTPSGRAAGLDLVIGHGKRPDVECPLGWGADSSGATHHRTVDAVPQAVTMMGGEYFFMPSLAFLQALA